MNITSQNVCTENSFLSNTVIHLWDLKSNDSSYIWKDFKDMESQSLIFNKCFKDELILTDGLGQRHFQNRKLSPAFKLTRTLLYMGKVCNILSKPYLQISSV